MMKLSHESKVRLGVGIGAFVLIIGLVFGISRTLIHFDGPWDLDDVVPGLSGMDDMFDEDDLLDGGNYSARPQQLSSTTFDEDAFQSLDLDVTSGTVEGTCHRKRARCKGGICFRCRHSESSQDRGLYTQD